MSNILTVVCGAVEAKIRALQVSDWPEIVASIEGGADRVTLAYTEGASVIWNADNGSIDLYVTVPGTDNRALYPLGGCGDKTAHDGDAKSLALMLMRWMVFWYQSQV